MERERKRVLSDDRYFSRLLHHYAYLTGGIYVEHLRRWTEVFPREQLLILSSRKLQSDRTQTYGRVLEFLDLPATPRSISVRSTRSPTRRWTHRSGSDSPTSIDRTTSGSGSSSARTTAGARAASVQT